MLPEPSALIRYRLALLAIKRPNTTTGSATVRVAAVLVTMPPLLLATTRYCLPLSALAVAGVV